MPQTLAHKIKAKYPGVYDDIPATPPVAGVAAHTDAHMGPPTPEMPVTLGDLQDNPAAAMARIGHLLKRDATDPTLWLTLAASYFGPQVFARIAPAVVRAAKATPQFAIRGAAAVGDIVDPDLVGVLSPRAGKVINLATKLRETMPAAARSSPPPDTPAVPTRSVPPSRPPAAGGGRPSINELLAARAGIPYVPYAEPEAPGATHTVNAAMREAVAAHRAATSPHAIQALVPHDKLTAEEITAGLQWLKEGANGDTIIKRLSSLRQLRGKAAFQALPTVLDAEASVAERNATGRWSPTSTVRRVP